MKKVKFCAETIYEKLELILTQFPKLTEIHPFYSDLINILYDKDHYKIALSQVNSAKTLCEKVEKDYIKLLKYSDSQYRCKTLKRAALGRMATILRKLKSTLPYLEQIRQHMSRLPSIDPYHRSLLIAGYPNVGKSSFMNSITSANVDVQNYPFTTKSLYVGHCDYMNNTWQVIDSPGILDHAVEEMNTIEMQSVCSFAHLDCCVLFFIDLSESCGYPIEDQISLFKNIKPLFKSKPIMVVFSKCDLQNYDSLASVSKAKVEAFFSEFKNLRYVQLSTLGNDNIGPLKTLACELFTEYKLKQDEGNEKANKILSRITIAQPKKRDERTRTATSEANIPNIGIETKVTAKDLQEEMGGAGVFYVPTQLHYQLDNPEWNFDKVPEFMDGMNVADFYDPDIKQKLDKLEAEEAEYERNMVIDVEDPTDKYYQLKGEQKKIKTYFKDKKLAKFLENTFKGNKSKVKKESILNRLREEKRIPEDVKEKLRKRMEEIDRKIDAGEESSDSEDDEDENTNSKKPRENKPMTAERKRIMERMSKLKLNRQRKMYLEDKDKKDGDMEDESEEALREKEKLKKLEIMRVKESKLKRSISKELKSKNKYDETYRRIESKKPKHLFSGKRTGFKFDHR